MKDPVFMSPNPWTVQRRPTTTKAIPKLEGNTA